MDYSINNGQYYKVIDKDTGELIVYGKLTDSVFLSTTKTVVFISQEEYEEHKPKPPNFIDCVVSTT